MASSRDGQDLIFEAWDMHHLDASVFKFLLAFVNANKSLRFRDANIDCPDGLAPVGGLERQDAVDTGSVSRATFVARLHGRVKVRTPGKMLAESLFSTLQLLGQFDEAALFCVSIARAFQRVSGN